MSDLLVWCFESPTPFNKSDFLESKALSSARFEGLSLTANLMLFSFIIRVFSP